MKNAWEKSNAMKGLMPTLQHSNAQAAVKHLAQTELQNEIMKIAQKIAVMGIWPIIKAINVSSVPQAIFPIFIIPSVS